MTRIVKFLSQCIGIPKIIENVSNVLSCVKKYFWHLNDILSPNMYLIEGTID